MGMKKRWSRQIVVGGTRYRYHVAEDRDSLALTIGIQQLDPAGQRLLARFDKPVNVLLTAPGVWWHEPIPTR